MQFEYDMVVLGAGSGGLVATSEARKLGAKVLLVESEKMGGDCLNHGCVPSKAFLKSAHLAHKMKNSAKYGLLDTSSKVDMQLVMGYVGSIVKEIEPNDSKERYENEYGAIVVVGKGVIRSPHEVEVNQQIYTTKRIMIATGSTAFIPPIKGLESVVYYTNHNIFTLDYVPKKMVVLGAGVIGIELGQGFAHLGSEVHMIDLASGIFSKDEPEVAGIMKTQLEKDNIYLHLGSAIQEIVVEETGKFVYIKKDNRMEKIEFDTILVALGRKPNTEGIGLENVGVKTNEKGFVVVDSYLHTNIESIYAVGDCKGKYMFTQAAGYEASIAIQNALLDTETKEVDYYNMSWCTYTVPEVAHVGYLELDAKDKNIHGSTEILSMVHNDKSKAEDDREGFIKVVLNKERIVIGATIVGERAGEMISIYSLMVTKKMSMDDLLEIIYPYPSQGELAKVIAKKSI